MNSEFWSGHLVSPSESFNTNESDQTIAANPLAGFELRVGNLRMLYNVEGEEVIILVVGRKIGNKLVVRR